MELLARDWIHCGADGRKEGVQFGIMQWNVLADGTSMQYVTLVGFALC